VPRSLLIVFIGCLALVPMTFAADYIWIEGENPTAKNVEVNLKGWGTSQILSGDAWLSLIVPPEQFAKMPADGAIIGYEFQAATAGNYEVWDRAGWEGMRAPFDWRIDQGNWQAIKPTDTTIDLMEIAPYVPLAWLKLGMADLTVGKHSFEFRVKPLFKVEKDKKIPLQTEFACDALCLTQRPFRPNGKYKPDEDWQNEADKKAAEHVFELNIDGAKGPDRTECSLGGVWQVGRFDEQVVFGRDEPTQSIPDAKDVCWTAANVPSNKFKDRPELLQCHRLIYRAQVNVPAEFAGRSFILRFPAICLMATLFVNGQACGFTKAPYALWECDATKAVKPGAVNDIWVVIKDSYYAITPKKANGAPTRNSFITSLDHISRSWVQASFDFPIGAGIFNIATSSGILQTPSMIIAGPVYTSDVFAIPNVKDKTLGLEVTVFNPTAKAQKIVVVNEATPAAGGNAEKTFAPQEASLEPGQETVVKVSESWPTPKLWWPEDPQLYHVVTKLQIDGATVDVRHTPFGFRQWEWDGPQFKLNGVPWNIRGDWACGIDALSNGSLQDSLNYYRASNQNSCRFWNPLPAGGIERSKILDGLDAAGIIVHRSGIMDGMGCNYSHALGADPALFDNWITQLKAQVKEERNHPSILIWSIENELTFINARNCNVLDFVEPHITRAAKAVMALDPTRPVMIDGGNCLRNQSLPVNGAHYIETDGNPPVVGLRDYPDQAYTFEKVAATQKGLFPLAMDRPIFMGECFFMNGYNAGSFAQFAGEGCFSGWGPGTQRGGGLFAKMLTEGGRWRGAAGWQLCLGGGQVANMHFNSQKPVAVFCREWNWTFNGGSSVKRTLKVFNDTHYTDPIDVSWEFSVNGQRAAGEQKTFNLSAGEHQEFSIGFDVPIVTKRSSGELVLTCARNGREVFRDAKPLAVLVPNAGPEPSVAQGDLFVIDPFGSVKERLKARGVAFTEIASVAQIPKSAKVVIIGKDVVGAREATDPQWLALAGNGTRVLVLEQAHPLHYQAIPADLMPTDFAGRVAFEENTEHPIFDGLEQNDFFTWSKDHIVYRNAYTKPTHGALSLAHCDDQLSCSVVAECPVNDGLLMLCQMVVGEKLAFDPVAQRIFDNMLAYCSTYVPIRYDTAAILPETSPALKLLRESGLRFDPSSDVLSAVAAGKHQIVIFDATPAALKSLADNLDTVKTFTGKGGWLMPWGVTPEGLQSFNKIVGVVHVLRPFELEYVDLPALRDPLLSGLTVREVAMESNEQIFEWAGIKYMVDDEFSSIVDFDDIAPFCEIPGAKAGDHAAARKAVANWPRNMFSGFSDCWKLIYYTNGNARIPLNLPREEIITEFSIIPNADYFKVTKVNVYFDDDPKPVSFTVKPANVRQNLSLEQPRKASKLVLELAEFDKPGGTSGINSLRIKVQRSDVWRAKVKPLLNIGGLVKYPQGSGGIILNQLIVKPAEANPLNMEKKRNIVTILLRNIHAAFAGSKLFTTANLKYQPLPLDERCNQYLSKVAAGSRATVIWRIFRWERTALPACISWCAISKHRRCLPA